MIEKVKYLAIAACVAAFMPMAASAEGGVSVVAAASKPVTSAEITGSVPSKLNVSTANTFNRLLKKIDDPNAAPDKDGIHDTANEGTFQLQPPKTSYSGWPTTDFGNHVDWVKVLNDGLINPRYDRVDPTVEPIVMDLDIVRPVKASVPDVVFPHKPHTEWLHCSNCHPKIFVPQAGSNKISMAAILLGEKCGVCHGKVSFPVTTKSCTKCHSKPKPKDWTPPLSDATVKNPWR